MNKWVTLAISAVSDFVITAGTAYTTIATSGTAVPSETQVIVCLIGGAIQAARGIQKSLSAPVQ